MKTGKWILAMAAIMLLAGPLFANGEQEAQGGAGQGMDFIVGVVTDTGGVDDKSFNQGTWEGAKRFADETGATAKYLQSETEADYIPNLSTFADEELDLIVAPGFMFTEAVGEVGKNFPEQKIAVIDTVVADLPNVASVLFAQNEGSFLVGVAGALKVKEMGGSKIGIVLGMDFPAMQQFEAGFEAGVKAVDPAMEIILEIPNSFADPQKGQTLASKLFDKGVKVIYQVAGGTGNGVIKEAKDRRVNGEEVWVIGVDKDQYADGIFNGKDSVILTSMLKRVDTASYEMSKRVKENNFPGGEIVIFDLANHGVGIPENNPNLSQDILNMVKSYEEKIKGKEIEVPLVPTRAQ